MKKLISAFLAAVIALTLAACASEQQNTDVPGNTQSEAPTSTPAPDSNTAIFAATEGTWRLDGELGLINSFYFDSDTQIHMGNNDGNIYIKEGA